MSIIGKIANKVSDYNRKRKYNLFVDCYKPTGLLKILDVGASEREYTKNANILEKKYPYPENITVLGVNNYIEFCQKYPKVRTIIYGGGVFRSKTRNLMFVGVMQLLSMLVIVIDKRFF